MNLCNKFRIRVYKNYWPTQQKKAIHLFIILKIRKISKTIKNAREINPKIIVSKKNKLTYNSFDKKLYDRKDSKNKIANKIKFLKIKLIFL